MSAHGQAEKEASEVLRSFNMMGAPQTSQNEPQNLSRPTSVTTSQPLVMIPQGHPPTQWHVHPQPVHIMYTSSQQTNPASTQTDNIPTTQPQQQQQQQQQQQEVVQQPPTTNGQDANQARNPECQMSRMPKSEMQQQQPGQQGLHSTQNQLTQLPNAPLEHSIWSTTEIGKDSITSCIEYALTDLPQNDETNNEYDDEEKPKIKKEVKKKRKLADLLAEGIDPTKLEENSDQVRDRFMKGCECDGDNCFKNMNPEFVFRHRLNIAELTKNEHDMYLMGVTMACLANPEETSRHKERKRLRASYVFQGKKVCLDAFLYLENCTHYQLKAIRKHVMVNGVTPRVHGNHGKKPPNTFPLDTYQHAAAFLSSYIARYSPTSATPKKANKSGKGPPVYLPADITRKKIHNAYKEYCEHFEPDVKVMGYSSFRHFMKEQFPNVKFFRLEKKERDRLGGPSDDDDDDEHEPSRNLPKQQDNRNDNRVDPNAQQQQQQVHLQPPPPDSKDTRNTPPVTSAQSGIQNAHNGVPASMPHASNYQYSHSGIQLPLNLQTQQPLYSAACMQPGMFPPGQAPQVRPSFPYTNL